MSYEPYVPPTRGRIALIVGLCVLGLLVPVGAGAYFAYAARTDRRRVLERFATAPAHPIGYHRVPPDESGPGYTVRGPDGWRISQWTNDAALGYRRSGYDGPDERIAITTYAEDTTTSVRAALDLTVRALPGLTATGEPRARDVGGRAALAQRLRSGDGTRETWLCVFRSDGARWVALHEGPARDDATEPRVLAETLDSWRW